jgi:hypothetical protein
MRRRHLAVLATPLLSGALAVVWMVPERPAGPPLPNYPPPVDLPVLRGQIAAADHATLRLLGPPDLLMAGDVVGPDDVVYDGQRLHYRTPAHTLGAGQVRDLIGSLDARLRAGHYASPACIVEPGIIATLEGTAYDGQRRRTTVAFCYVCGVMVVDDDQQHHLEVRMERRLADAVLDQTLAVFPGDPVLSAVTWTRTGDPLPWWRLGAGAAVLVVTVVACWGWRLATRSSPGLP